MIWTITNGVFYEDKHTTLSSTFAIVWHFIHEVDQSQYVSMQNIVDDIVILQRLWIHEIPWGALQCHAYDTLLGLIA